MHFFTEPSKLDPQTASDPFGPVDGDEANKYRISSKHKVNADAKIFACQDAMMIVQQDDVNTGLVNLILKPLKGLGIAFDPVKYYVYRGVDKSSFLAGAAIIPKATSGKTEFLDKFWANWDIYTTVTGTPITPSPEPKSFGYDPLLASSPQNESHIEELYNSSESTNALLNDFQSIKVSEGEWIANVLSGESFSFEIIMDSDHLQLDFAYFQKQRPIIDATGLSIDPNNPYLGAVAQRDKILNYIDPAAFFGMHSVLGVKIAVYSGLTKMAPVVKRGVDLVNDVLSTFINKDVVYLDIRSERGYSYYYYQNYRIDFFSGNLLQWSEVLDLKSASQAAFASLDYATLSWPLLNLTIPNGFLSPIIGGEKIELKLHIKDNEMPLLFVQNPKLLGASNTDNFVKDNQLRDYITIPTPDKTYPIVLEVPFITQGPNDVNIAHHIKLQYFRQADSSLSPVSVLKNPSYLDIAFGGIKLPEIEVETPFKHIQNAKKTFVNSGGFSFVANTGVYQDDTKILFYSESSYTLKSSGKEFPKFDVTTTPVGDIDGILATKNVIYNKLQVNDGVSNIDILSIVGYNRVSNQTTPTENLMFLGLTKAEYDSLLVSTSLSDLHQIYFTFEELFDLNLGPLNPMPLKDVNSGAVYRKFKLKIHGLKITFDTDIVDTFPPFIDIEVYGTNLNMLCSASFAAASVVPNMLPDPGTMAEYDFTHTFKYDGNDALVTGLFPTGSVKIPDNQARHGFTKPESGLIGEITYPVKVSGTDVIHDRQSNYPLVVVVHANGGRYTDYRDLCIHLAKNGFIAASISGLLYYGPGKIKLFTNASLAADFTFSTIFPADYYIIKLYAADKIYIYNNDAVNPPINANYQYQKLTVLTGTLTENTAPTPDLYTISTERLLDSWTLGSEFDIILASGVPDELEFLIKVGNHDMGTSGRSNLLYPHLQIIKTKLGSNVQNKIGVIGHSRGGEAVVRIAKDIGGVPTFNITTPTARTGTDKWKYVPNDLNNLEAVISLAPTDGWDQENLIQDIPYYVLYGSMDGDVAGYSHKSAPNRNTGFSLLDRAVNTTEKAMTFVHGATHNGFITDNHDYNQQKYPDFSTAADLILPSIQKTITLAYMNAYMRLHLRGETYWNKMFQGEYVPTSVRYKELYPQYKNMKVGESFSVTNFEVGSSIGLGVGKVSLQGALTNLDEGDIITIADYSPHDSKGISVVWTAGDELKFNISSSGQDVSAFNYVSFRICHKVQITPKAPVVSFIETKHAYEYNDPTDPLKPTHYSQATPIAYNAIINGTYSDLTDLEVQLSDGSTPYKRTVNTTIPAPHFRELRYNHNRSDSGSTVDDKGTSSHLDDTRTFEHQSLTKSALMTIRIPLSDYISNGVDVTSINELSLIFPAGSGEVIIDDVEFTR